MEYICNICNKKYSSYQSLWIHNKKFHIKKIISNVLPNESSIIILKNQYKCKICNITFDNRQKKWRHQTKCSISKLEINKENILELEKIILEQEKIKLLKEEKEIEKLKLKIELKKTIKGNNIINNTINNNNNNNNNIIINNMGDESVSNLSILEIKKLAQQGSNALTYIIEQLNFNKKHPENYIFCTTSLEGDYVSVYNKKTNSINKEIKKEYHDKLLLNSIRKIDEVLCLTEFDENYIIDNKYIKILEKVVTAHDIHFKNNKKVFASTINQLSYNNNKNILDVWKKISNINENIEASDDESI